jgi:RNA polymerase sigma factor (TIGR02999 family)
MTEIPQIVAAIDQGDLQAAGQLLPLVYDELRKLAAEKLSHEKPGQTLEATGLVHEAYLRLIGGQRFKNRRHFYGAAAEAMRRILVENARRKARQKRGGGLHRVELGDPPCPEADTDLPRLDEALNRLSNEDSLAARVVELRYFAGLGHEAVAETLQISVYLARQKWAYARAWLRQALDSSS